MDNFAHKKIKNLNIFFLIKEKEERKRRMPKKTQGV
jgi:hypothetical protein